MSLLASEVISLQALKEFAGSLPFGIDTNEWPAKWFDVVRTAQMEDMRISDEVEADMKRRGA